MELAKYWVAVGFGAAVLALLAVAAAHGVELGWMAGAWVPTNAYLLARKH